VHDGLAGLVEKCFAVVTRHHAAKAKPRPEAGGAAKGRPALTAAARAGFLFKLPGRKNAPRGPNQRMAGKEMTR